jgi:predicted alpha/beta-fold hydrolase
MWTFVAENWGVGVLLCLTAYVVYYVRYVAKVPSVYGKPTAYRRELLRRCPSLLKRYAPPMWLPGPHATTIAMTALRAGPDIAYTREFLDTPDGGAIAVDIAFPDEETARNDELGRNGDGRPVLLVLHGLTGGSHENYVRALAARVLGGLGWTVAVHNFRGCGGSPLLNGTPYSAATTEDVRGTLAYLGERFPRRLIFACGFSLGANVLTKTVGEMGSECPLAGAIALCNPFDCMVGNLTMQASAMGRLYSRKLAMNLSNFARGHRHVLRDSPHVDLDAGMRSRSVHEFDELLTRRNFGYSSVSEYYADASSSRYVRRIRIPFVAISALDDPIAVREAIPYAECISNPAVTLITTAAGGHVAWPAGALTLPGRLESWAEGICVELLEAMLATRDTFFAWERSGLTHKRKIDHLRHYTTDDPLRAPPKPGSIWSPRRRHGDVREEPDASASFNSSVSWYLRDDWGHEEESDRYDDDDDEEEEEEEEEEEYDD